MNMLLSKKRRFCFALIHKTTSDGKRLVHNYVGPFEEVFSYDTADLQAMRELVSSDLVNHDGSRKVSENDEAQSCIQFIKQNRAMLIDEPENLDELIAIFEEQLKK